MTTILAQLNQIKEGEVVLPAIQRDFVWAEDKCTKLLDSLLRGYPIGIILLWETYLDIQYRNFDRDYRPDSLAMFADNPKRKKLRVVLDGQQRLQSLYVAMYGSYAGKHLYFDVLSGLEQDDKSDDRFIFRFLSSSQLTAEHTDTIGAPREGIQQYYERVSELINYSAIAKMGFIRSVVQSRKLDDQAEARLRLNLDTLEKALSVDENVLKVATIDENLTSDSPARKTESDVLEIFVRINRQGTPLSRSDLVFSMLKLNWRESAEALPEFVRRVNQGNSFGLDTDFVIRCLFAISDLGAKVDIDVLRRSSNVTLLRERFDRCCDAIRSTLDFVQTHCWLSTAAIIGGLQTLVPIVYYIAYRPGYEVRHEQLVPLRQMFYLFALGQPFARYGESRVGAFIRSDLKTLRAGGSGDVPVQQAADWLKYWESLQSLEDLVRANPPLVLHLVQSRSGGQVQYVANSPEVDHIFPRSVLREAGYPETEINDVANFWILARRKNRNKSNRPPREYFADVSDDELRTALIEPSLLDYDRYLDFLSQRRAAIVTAVEERVSLSRLMTGADIIARSNPSWSTIELILALDLYRRRGQLDAGAAEVGQLSALLNVLGSLEGRHRTRPTYRNANGVAMKLANFAALDPNYRGVGLRSYGQNDELVWREYGDRSDLSAIADDIRMQIARGYLPRPDDHEPEHA